LFTHSRQGIDREVQIRSVPENDGTAPLSTVQTERATICSIRPVYISFSEKNQDAVCAIAAM
jgi:hypothetical protein